ncbi:MAG: hypothetical protein HDR50_05355 [Desulfovibrio sp.]|uniref:hypothetical protein n=1 Tax=Desulfovibrio sp. TaxID=885 RepID=UPI001A7AB8C8|nr:hypothetical protein [Desulfovibrio sp.]MBD5417080.1 hypothetical protein [Desulfovibrio sp.]
MMGHAFDRLQGVSIDQYTGASGLLQTPTRSEYLGAHVAQGFERTTTGRILEETDIMDAERREGTADEEYRQNAQMLLAQGMTPEAAGMTHARAMSKESWEASPWFRKGMEYRPDMTQTRARIMAENYDERRYREQVVTAGDASYGLLTRSLGFGAMLIGSLPDPVNFVSFAGGAVKAQAALRAAAGAGAAAKAGAIAGMKAGIVEGALGNALADAIVLPDLAARGEDVGFTDLMLDTIFGAIIGAGMGSAGGALAGYVGAKRLARLEGLTRRMEGAEPAPNARPQQDAGEFGTPDNDFLARVGGGEDVARMEDDFHLPRNDDADMARASLTGRDKRDAARAMEKAVSDVSDGRPVDVGPVLRESQALGRAYDTVRENPLGGPADEVLASLSSPEFERILVERGPGVEGPEGEIIVKDDAFVKTHGSRGWGLVKILWRHGEKSKADPRFQVTREDIVGMPQRIREFEPVQEATRQMAKRETRWTIDNGDGTRTVYAIAKRKKGHDSPTLITVFRTGTDGYGLSEKRKAPYFLGGREPSHGGKSPNYQDTAGGGLKSLVPEAKGKESISTGRPNVNFAVEQRENYAPAPDVEAHDAQGARDAADAATLQKLEEMTASGRMDEESARALAESRDMAARAEQYDELGQSVIECIWKAEA